MESEPDQGSAFHFELELGYVPRDQEKVLSPSPDLRGIRVLVVDDNSTFQEIIKNMLTSFSFEVDLASNGREAISILDKAMDAGRPIKLILMDWKMPGMDGLEASRRIKMNRRLSKTPTIIMVTAYGREEIIQQAEQIGLDGFLIKPLSRSVLFDTIMESFGKHIPRKKRRPSEVAKNDAVLEAVNGISVLLVEDNPINQDVARELLESVGVKVTVANNGREAVEATAAADFDAVLMDIQMPVMDGYEATSIIRERESEERRMPIIAMTANVMEGDRERARAAGVDDQVDKPITPSLLYSTLARWVAPELVRAAEGDDGRKETAATDPATPWPVRPGLDTADGLHRLDGNRVMYQRLLQRFTEDQADVIDRIGEAVVNADRELAGSLLHTLKGLSGTLGARELADAAKELEKRWQDESRVPLIKDLEDLHRHFEQTLTAIEAVVEEGDKALKQEIQLSDSMDIGEFQAGLENLEYLLKEDDYEAHSEIAKIADQARNSKIIGDINRIKRKIDGYDYADALNHLKILQDKLSGREIGD